MRGNRLLWVLLSTLFAVPVAAQEPPEEEPEEPVELAYIVIPENTPLLELLQRITKTTGKPLLYDPESPQIKGQTLGAGFSHGVPTNKVFDTFRAILAFYQLILVPIGPEGYEIYLVIDQRSTNQIVKNKAEYVDYRNLDLYKDRDGYYISVTIPLRHIDNLQTLRNALQQIATAGTIGRVHEIPGSQSIMIVDFAPNVWAMYQLIKQMDVPPPGKALVMEFLELEYAYAADVADIITELLSAQREAVLQRPNQPQADYQSPEPRLLAYEPRNALVVAAAEEDYELIQSLVKRFDVPGELTSLVEVVRLNHVEANDLADTLSQVLEGMEGFFPGTEPQPGQAPGGRTRQQGIRRTGGSAIEQQPQVVPDPGTNSLILAGDRKTIAALKEIVLQLDLPKDQVLIEAALISLTRTDDFQLGIELVGIDETGLESDTYSGFGVTNFGLSTFEDTDGDLIPDLNLPTNLATEGGGVVAGIFRNGGIPVLLQAVQRLNEAKIVSMPSVVTYDNEGAELQALNEQPVGQQTELASGGLSTGFQGFEEAGVVLTVSPHISADNYLRLELTLEVSSFIGSSTTAGLPPPRSRNVIDTVVALPNEHTVVMGGLISEEDSVSEDKVPILGDVPVLGYLFKNKNRRKIKRNLYVFVTPHILRQNRTEFDELHRQTWLAKMKMDELVGAVEIHNSNFRFDPRYRTEEDVDAEMLDVSSLIDAGRFHEIPAEQALLEIQQLERRAARESDD